MALVLTFADAPFASKLPPMNSARMKVTNARRVKFWVKFFRVEFIGCISVIAQAKPSRVSREKRVFSISSSYRLRDYISLHLYKRLAGEFGNSKSGKKLSRSRI